MWALGPRKTRLWNSEIFRNSTIEFHVVHIAAERAYQQSWTQTGMGLELDSAPPKFEIMIDYIMNSELVIIT